MGAARCIRFPGGGRKDPLQPGLISSTGKLGKINTSLAALALEARDTLVTVASTLLLLPYHNTGFV